MLAVMVSTFMPNEPYTSNVDLGVVVPIPICAFALMQFIVKKINAAEINFFIRVNSGFWSAANNDTLQRKPVIEKT